MIILIHIINQNKINIKSKSQTNAVLDGQQRLTSLMNVLFVDKIYIRDVKYALFFNEETEEFKFLIDGAEKRLKKDKKYPTKSDYKVKDIYEGNIKGKRNCEKLEKRLRDFHIRYEIYDGSLEKAMEVFHRLNTNGTKLTSPEIYLSLIINNNKKEGKTFKNDINKIKKQYKDKYNIELDLGFFIKSIIICILEGAKYDVHKVEDNKNKILNNYGKVFEAIGKVCRYCKNNINIARIIKSKNILIPLVYYCYKGNKLKDSARGVKYYIVTSAILGVFGGQSDDVLLYMKKHINKYNKKSFDIKIIKDEINIKRTSYRFVKKDIERMLDNKYITEPTKIILYLIYSSIDNSFVYSETTNIDHLHPKKYFKTIDINDKNSKEYKELKNNGLKNKDIKVIIEKEEWNKIPNLKPISTQTDYGEKGKKDKNLDKWIQDHPEYKDETMQKCNDKDYALKNFRKFYKKRKKVMIDILNNYFNKK